MMVDLAIANRIKGSKFHLNFLIKNPNLSFKIAVLFCNISIGIISL